MGCDDYNDGGIGYNESMSGEKKIGKRSEFDRSIETCSHLPKSEVVDI